MSFCVQSKEVRRAVLPTTLTRAAAMLAGCAWATLGLAAQAPQVTVETLTLEMDRGDAKDLVKKGPYDKSTFPVAIVEPGPQPRRLTGRIEVKGSFSRILEKKALLIRLDEGVTWRGQSRVLVDSRGTDGTLMRDWLAWDLWRALGMPTPETRYLRLMLNGESRGLYLQVGWIEPALFERHGLGRDGELYQPPDDNHCGDLSPESVRDAERCWRKLSPQGAMLDSLRALVAAIDAEPAESFDRFVDRTFDSESVINWFALNAVISNSDTYDKNYFLYRSARTRKWHVLPFDFDLSQGRTYDPHQEFPRNILNAGFTYWYPLEQGLPNPLHTKALRNAVLRKRIRTRIGELIDAAPGPARPWRGRFALAKIEERIASLRQALLPVLAEDPNLAGRQEQFEEDVAALRRYYRARLRYLQKMVVREDALKVRDTAQGALPAPGGEVDLVDEAGFLLATLRLRRAEGPARKGAAVGGIDLTVQRAPPDRIPPGVKPAACIQRTWFLTASAAIEADVTLEYHQETVQASDLGSKVSDERRLALFLHAPDGETWTTLPTTVNIAANTLTTVGLPLPRGEGLVLVACETRR